MSILGNRVLRKEDPGILHGETKYVADIADPLLEGAVHATYVRSTMPQGRSAPRTLYPSEIQRPNPAHLPPATASILEELVPAGSLDPPLRACDEPSIIAPVRGEP